MPRYEKAIYSIQWLGISIGRATVRWQESSTAYQMVFQFRTAGIVQMFDQYDLSAIVVGHVRQEGQSRHYTPIYYSYRKNKVQDMVETRIRYDSEGHIWQRSVAPPDNPLYRHPVSTDGQNDALDPITSLLAVLGGKTSFTIYDGRRLIEAIITPAPLPAEETDTSRRAIILSRSPLEGHTLKELRAMERDRPVIAIMRPDTSRFPEEMQVESRIGTIRAERIYAP
ncbi:MAG: DUF3108 domain-containing protein [Rickettsiales bacterium]|nr:DUF3108 domain-containing protein [Rickettsiales bacterium]